MEDRKRGEKRKEKQRGMGKKRGKAVWKPNTKQTWHINLVKKGQRIAKQRRAQEAREEQKKQVKSRAEQC